MGMQRMRVRITKDGDTEIRVEGSQGEDCLTFTNKVEQAIGRVLQREFTADFYAQETVKSNATVTEICNL